MTPFRSAALLLTTLLLATSVVLAGPGLLAASPDVVDTDPALVDFVATGGVCATGVPLLAVEGDGTTLRLTADVEVPNPSYVVRFDRFERVDDETYALSVVSEPTDKPAVQCVAHARYTATVETPGDALAVVVYHDGEEVGQVGAGASGSSELATQTA